MVSALFSTPIPENIMSMKSLFAFAFVLASVLIVPQGVPAQFGGQPAAAGGPGAEDLLKGSQIPYKKLNDKAYEIEINYEGKTSRFHVYDLVAGPKDKPYKVAQVHWGLGLPNTFQPSLQFFSKLNDLNNADIYANITYLVDKQGPYISGDYLFPVTQGMGSDILIDYMTRAYKDLQSTVREISPLVQGAAK
jgi:hypothetical protein